MSPQRLAALAAVLAVPCLLLAPWGSTPADARSPASATRQGPQTHDPADAFPGPGPALPERFPPLGPEPLRPDAEAVEAWVDGVTASVPNQDDPYAVIDACVRQEMQQTDTPGASIAIAVDGAIAYTKGYGVKHKENGGEIDAQTRFRIGSTTKQLTAAAVMQLAEAGKVDLEAPVTEYLPDLVLAEPWDAGKLTLRHLLTHSGGLPDTYLLTGDEYSQVSLETWATDYLPYTPLNAPPGTFWNYSNPNFSLAGLVVEAASGETYADYIENHVFGPAGMTLSTIDPNAAMTNGNFAYGHQGAARLTPLDFDWPSIEPAGSAMSTPTDMVNWALTLANGGGQVLGAQSASAMQAPQINTGYVPWENYGFGIFVTEYEDTTDPARPVMVYDHGGNVYGYSSQLFWVPERRFAVSILANTMTSLSGSAACALREIAKVKQHSYAGQTTPPETWGAYEGTYAMMNVALWDFTARVTRESTGLVMRYLDLGSTLPLVQFLKDTFFIDLNGDGQPDSPVDWTFIRDKADSNKVSFVRFRQIVGERVGQFPASVTVEGDGCSPLAFTPDIDLANLAVRASGVSQGTVVEQGLPISASDPADPRTSSYKLPLEIRGEAGMFFVAVTPEQDDNLELYVMYDDDGNGSFEWPTELYDFGLPDARNQRLLLMNGRQPAGRYELWVHGTVVSGEGSKFTMVRNIVHGENLRVKDAPTRATAGTQHTLQVCGQNTGSLAGPQSGFVEFDYGSPPRRVRIPVQWVQGTGPTPTPTPEPRNRVYLPFVQYGQR